MAFDRPISLVGLMGAGKSTVGRRLAKRLGLPFADSDQEVERTLGLSVAEIFERYGEPTFRAAERDAVAALLGWAGVIGTGGGAFMSEATRELMLEKTWVVWLDAEVERLVERVRRSDHRPLLAGRDPETVLRALSDERSPVYAQAHFRIETDAPPDLIVERIVAALNARF